MMAVITVASFLLGVAAAAHQKNVTYMSGSPLRTKFPIILSSEALTASTKREEAGLSPLRSLSLSLPRSPFTHAYTHTHIRLFLL